MLLVALGFVTLPNTTVWLPVGAAELPVFFMRSLPPVEVLTLQPDASPRFVGWDDSVDELLLNPLGVEQAPLAVVQMTASNDCKTVEDGTVKVKVYVVAADATELPRVSARPVICAALACGAQEAIHNARRRLMLTPTLPRRCIICLIRVFMSKVICLQ